MVKLSWKQLPCTHLLHVHMTDISISLILNILERKIWHQIERNQYFTDTKQFCFIKIALYKQKVFREIITVKAFHFVCFGCQQSFSTRRWVQGFVCFLNCRYLSSGMKTLLFSSRQCTGANTRSCSRSSWSCRVQTVSSVSCAPPPS